MIVMADEGAQGQQKDYEQDQNANIKKLGGVIPVDMNHVKSVCGFLELIIAGLSLIAYICIESRDYCYRFTFRGHGFFATMSMSTFLTMLLWWLLEVLTVCQRLNIKWWRLWEMIVLGAYGGLFLIADIVVASQTCGQGAIGAAAFFGFAAVIAMGVHFYFSFRVWQATESPAARRAQARQAEQQAVEDGPYTMHPASAAPYVV